MPILQSKRDYPWQTWIVFCPECSYEKRGRKGVGNECPHCVLRARYKKEYAEINSLREMIYICVAAAIPDDYDGCYTEEAEINANMANERLEELLLSIEE